jgi:hypothetical protein
MAMIDYLVLQKLHLTTDGSERVIKPGSQELTGNLDVRQATRIDYHPTLYADADLPHFRENLNLLYS